MGGGEAAVARDVGDLHEIAGLDLLAKVGRAQDVALADLVVLGGVLQGQRDDAEVDQVLPVDAGEAPGDDRAEAQVARRGWRRRTRRGRRR